jgi:peptidoglycan/LPS O-acetylase OafA/YrhL
MQQKRLTNLDIFRAVAALAVCLFHFGNNNLLGIPVLSSFLQHGHLGVIVFFVISGYIIPYALFRSGYGIAYIKGFLVSRFIRLYPAYFFAGISAVLLWYISTLVPGFRGEQPSFTFSQIFSNLFLLCDFTDTSWFIPVFWTLAIEAQYYLLIAVSFPLLLSRNPALRCCIIAGWVLAPLVAGIGPSVFTWTALFALGIVIFYGE